MTYKPDNMDRFKISDLRPLNHALYVTSNMEIFCANEESISLFLANKDFTIWSITPNELENILTWRASAVRRQLFAIEHLLAWLSDAPGFTIIYM